MFASGNNTERKRMGEIRGNDEFVVDLYAVCVDFLLLMSRESGTSRSRSLCDQEQSTFFVLKSIRTAWKH